MTTLKPISSPGQVAKAATRSTMRLLLIDNYDSFTFNLLQYFGELGATTRVVRNNKLSVNVIKSQYESRHNSSKDNEEAFDAIVLSPGPCGPNEAGICMPLVKVLSGTIPILGVCLGHQSIAAAFGASIVKAKSLMHGKTSDIMYTQDVTDNRSLFAELPNPVRFGRYHSLAIDESTLPENLVVNARTTDGEIMAIHHRSHPTFGVQFHPESVLSPHGKTLLKNFLEIVAAHNTLS